MRRGVSAAKRRRMAKLAQLKRLDANHGWLHLMKSPRRDGRRAAALWSNCIVSLGDKLESQKAGAWLSLERCAMGGTGLVENYRKRMAAQLGGSQKGDASETSVS